MPGLRSAAIRKGAGLRSLTPLPAGHLRNTLVSTNVFLVLDALEIAAEPNRRRLLHLLASHEQTVGELAAHFTVSRSAVSQHLLLLEQAGLVSARKEGRNRYYRLDPGGMGRLRDLVEQFWTYELDLLASDAAALAAQRHRPPQHHPTNSDTPPQDKGPLS
ncbi:DNA-binding transcriptional regulator, ArsR family [Arthrobacter sp. 49Tsu3.1M3]|jgi:DNA-binding transcriptional ArsR family regulator|nr:DNA-binding transcriptional regulator, ArsR family [Arthrobacter sp. 49Tsu3.1M3]